ncbi:hypothetical protein X975_27108, partial [Stegodyphus mimosarum]
MYTFVLILLLLAIEKGETKAKLDYSERLALAKSHYNLVTFQYMCGTPQPRVKRIEKPGFTLMPSHTVLHRCGDSTGCCDTVAKRCVAKTKEKVKLYFRMIPINSLQRRKNQMKVEKLIFTNHTECHCVDKRHIPR